MNKELVSVIVVIYKVEKFLQQCLDSLRNQTYSNIEIIMSVSDGGDNCIEICREYAQRDPRFIVVETEPRGIAAARNAGLDVVKGHYLAWVDGDDWVEATYIESLVNAIERTNTQLAICGFYKEFTDKVDMVNSLIESNIPVPIEEICKEIISYRSFGMEIWDKLFIADDVKKIKFPKVKEAEDRFWLQQILENISKAAYSGTMEYHYRMRGDSCSRTNENASVSLEADEILAEMIRRKFPSLDSQVALFLFLAEYRTLYEAIENNQDYGYKNNKQLYFKLRENAKKSKQICTRTEDTIKIRMALINYNLLTEFVRLTQKRRMGNDNHKDAFQS